MTSWWRQHPQARPTFKAIVADLKVLHRELITGSEIVSKYFDDYFLDGSNSLDISRATPEANLIELHALLQAILVKHIQANFILLLLEVVANIEQYLSVYGLRSFKQYPILPFPEWFAREKMLDRIRWRLEIFVRLKRTSLRCIESPNCCLQLCLLSTKTSMLAIYKNYSFNGFTAVQSATINSDLKAREEECHARVLPESQHDVCIESHEDVTYASVNLSNWMSRRKVAIINCM